YHHSCYHRDLHSFPTRRSSDLNVKEQLNNKEVHPLTWIPSTWFAMGLPFVALSTAATLMYKNLGVSDSKIAFWTSLIMMPWTLKDRKSTRLNSSHVKISYAVFC